MKYCLNPFCASPENKDNHLYCISCGSKLLIKDRYQPIAVIGAGGMGRTSLALDQDRLGDRCVIKQFYPQFISKPFIKKAIELFNTEAKSLYKLGETHPQIPTLLAYFEENNHLYLVQEYIEGQSLQTELKKNGPFSQAKIIQLLEQLLPILQFIHQQGIIHRDLKPDNIIRRLKDAKLVLIDFGASKHVNNSWKTLIGTPGYAPIEQLQGGQAYPGSDLYSLGVTCLHLLTGTPPQELQDIYTGQWKWLQILQQQNEKINPNLTAILNKLVAPWIKERYQNATEVINDLKAINLIKKHPTWKLINSLTDFNSAIYTLTIDTKQETIITGDKAGTIKKWHLATGTLLQTISISDHAIYGIVLSRDGEKIAIGCADGTIKIWNQITQTLELNIWTHAQVVKAIATSPDYSIIISGGSDGLINIYSTITKKRLRTINAHSLGITNIITHGSTLITASRANTIKLWDMETGEKKNTITGHSDGIYSIGLSPDHQYLASSSLDGTIKIWYSSTGQLCHTLYNHGIIIKALAFSPDGKTLIGGSSNHTISLWDVESFQLLSTITAHHNSIDTLAITPDGQTLITGSRDQTVNIWKLIT